MKWNISPVGKPSFSWVRQGVAEYEKRLARYSSVRLRPVKTHDKLHIPSSGVCWVLDETGVTASTAELADKVRDLEDRGIREITVCIGGADGVGDSLRDRADLLLSLGPHTMMHELALLVWMEQVYRVHTLLAGHPYHREG